MDMTDENLNIQFAITGQGYNDHDAHDSFYFLIYSMHFPLVEIKKISQQLQFVVM